MRRERGRFAWSARPRHRAGAGAVGRSRRRPRAREPRRTVRDGLPDLEGRSRRPLPARAQPPAVVVGAVGRGAPRAGEPAAVVGAGTLGLLALQLLRLRGARVMIAGRTLRRFALAREFGAEETCAVSETSAETVARRFSGREGVDLVVETAGTAEAVTEALALVRPGGRIV